LKPTKKTTGTTGLRVHAPKQKEKQMKKQNKSVQPETVGVNNNNAVTEMVPVPPKHPVALNGDVSKVTLEGENLEHTAKVVDLMIKLHNDVVSSITTYKAVAVQAVKSAIRCGKLLLLEKDKRKKTFSAWIMVYLPFSHETANRYMRLATSTKLNIDEITSLRQAYILCGITKVKKPVTTTGTGSSGKGAVTTIAKSRPPAGTTEVTGKEIMVYVWLKTIMEELPKYDKQTIDELLPVMQKSIIKWYNLETAKRAVVDLTTNKDSDCREPVAI